MSAGNPLEIEKNRQIIKNSPRYRKMVVLFFSLFTLFVVALSVWRFYAFLNAPFKVDEKKGNGEDNSAYLEPADSDSDGISDSDEVNVYKTSPYLPDSDSDGISDYNEITDGTDPNCPAGKTCDTADTAVNVDSSSTVNTISDDLTATGEEGAVSATGEVTPDFLRQILIQSGSDTSTVNKISDEEIMAAYQEAVNSQASSTNQ